jgi:hypothetical protein
MNGSFLIHADEFRAILGNAPTLVKVVDADAHEGPVYARDEDALYFTSLPQATDTPLPGFRNASLKRVQLNGDRFPVAAQALSVVRAHLHKEHFHGCQHSLRHRHHRHGRGRRHAGLRAGEHRQAYPRPRAR